MQIIYMFFGSIINKAAWVLIFTIPTIASYFWIVSIAFRKNFWIGIPVLIPVFIPMLIFVTMNWKETRAPFTIMIACGSIFLGMILHYQNHNVHIQPEIESLERMHNQN